MLAANIVSNVRKVQLKSGVGKESGRAYRIWSLTLDDLDGFETSPVIGILDETATRMDLENHPEKIVGQKFNLICKLSFTRSGYNFIPRLDVVEFVPFVEKQAK